MQVETSSVRPNDSARAVKAPPRPRANRRNGQDPADEVLEVLITQVDAKEKKRFRRSVEEIAFSRKLSF